MASDVVASANWLPWNPQRIQRAKIVIPQALRSSVLPMTNLFIAVMLTTALGSQVPLKPQELTGVALDGPVVALFGRGGTPGGVPRPEAVKEALFSDAGLADQVTGRFRLEPAADGAPLTLHVQCRHDAPPAARHADTLRAVVAGVAGEPVDVRWHAAAEYPFHAPDDWTHKPRYTR